MQNSARSVSARRIGLSANTLSARHASSVNVRAFATGRPPMIRSWACFCARGNSSRTHRCGAGSVEPALASTAFAPTAGPAGLGAAARAPARRPPVASSVEAPACVLSCDRHAGLAATLRYSTLPTIVGSLGRSSWGNGIIGRDITIVNRLACWMPEKRSIQSNKMQTSYPLRVQAIRSRGQNPRLYVSFPLALAAAIGLEPGDDVQWELLDRGELHLLRLSTSSPTAKSKAKK